MTCCKLLVSVQNESEALEAIAGGADIIDVKDPFVGSLGRPTICKATEVSRAVGQKVPWTMAIGELANVSSQDLIGYTTILQRSLLELPFEEAHELRTVSPMAVKIGLAQMKYQNWEERLGELEALVSRFVLCVPVAYADAKEVLAPDPEDVFAQAARTGKSLVLVDTCRKDFGGLFEIIEETVIRRWCRCVQAAGMQIAIAGKLTLADIHRAAELGPDVVAVRSGVCVGGRLGRVSAHLVAAAKSLCGNERVSIH